VKYPSNILAHALHAFRAWPMHAFHAWPMHTGNASVTLTPKPYTLNRPSTGWVCRAWWLPLDAACVLPASTHASLGCMVPCIVRGRMVICIAFEYSLSARLCFVFHCSLHALITLPNTDSVGGWAAPRATQSRRTWKRCGSAPFEESMRRLTSPAQPTISLLRPNR
jgi:hypothetical protein